MTSGYIFSLAFVNNNTRPLLGVRPTYPESLKVLSILFPNTFETTSHPNLDSTQNSRVINDIGTDRFLLACLHVFLPSILQTAPPNGPLLQTKREERIRALSSPLFAQPTKTSPPNGAVPFTSRLPANKPLCSVALARGGLATEIVVLPTFGGRWTELGRLPRPNSLRLVPTIPLRNLAALLEENIGDKQRHKERKVAR